MKKFFNKNHIIFIAIIAVLCLALFYVLFFESVIAPAPEISPTATPRPSLTPTLKPTLTPAPTSPQPTIVGFESKKENTKMVLYRIYSDGKKEKTGLEVEMTWLPNVNIETNIVVSPDQTKAVFNKYIYGGWWGPANGYQSIYISNIDGSKVKELSKQVSRENGRLVEGSLRWSDDGKFIYYYEDVVIAKDPAYLKAKITYRVNIETGERVEISREPY